MTVTKLFTIALLACVVTSTAATSAQQAGAQTGQQAGQEKDKEKTGTFSQPADPQPVMMPAGQRPEEWKFQKEKEGEANKAVDDKKAAKKKAEDDKKAAAEAKKKTEAERKLASKTAKEEAEKKRAEERQAAADKKKADETQRVAAARAEREDAAARRAEEQSKLADEQKAADERRALERRAAAEKVSDERKAAAERAAEEVREKEAREAEKKAAVRKAAEERAAAKAEKAVEKGAESSADRAASGKASAAPVAAASEPAPASSSASAASAPAPAAATSSSSAPAASKPAPAAAPASNAAQKQAAAPAAQVQKPAAGANQPDGAKQVDGGKPAVDPVRPPAVIRAGQTPDEWKMASEKSPAEGSTGQRQRQGQKGTSDAKPSDAKASDAKSGDTRSASTAAGQSKPAASTPPKPKEPWRGWSDRALISLNAGWQAASFDLRDTRSFDPQIPGDREQRTLAADYSVKSGVSLDLGGGFRVWRGLAAGVSVTRFKDSRDVPVSGSVPHPFFFNRARSIEGVVSGAREEMAVHVDAMWVVPIRRNMTLALFGGPSFYSVKQTVVSDYDYNQSYPYDDVTLTRVVSEDESTSVNGINVGADVGYYFTETIGIGGVIRFGRASVDTSIGSLDVGGPEFGVGLRIRIPQGRPRAPR